MTLWIWTSHTGHPTIQPVIPAFHLSLLPCTRKTLLRKSSVKVNTIQVYSGNVEEVVATSPPKSSLSSRPNSGMILAQPIQSFQSQNQTWTHEMWRTISVTLRQVILRFYVFSACPPTVSRVARVVPLPTALCLGLCDGQGSCEALLEAPLLQELLGQEPVEMLDSG